MRAALLSHGGLSQEPELCAPEENPLLIQRQVNIPALSFHFSATIPADAEQQYFLT